MTEKSVFTKSGPESGARDESPSSPARGTAKAQGLNQYPEALNLLGPVQPELAAIAPAWNGLPTSLARPAGDPVPTLIKLAPESGLLSIMNTGKPEVIFSMSVTCQFPRTALVALFQSLPNFLPLPKGKS